MLDHERLSDSLNGSFDPQQRVVGVGRVEQHHIPHPCAKHAMRVADSQVYLHAQCARSPGNVLRRRRISFHGRHCRAATYGLEGQHAAAPARVEDTAPGEVIAENRKQRLAYPGGRWTHPAAHPDGHTAPSQMPTSNPHDAIT